jgi:adenosylhomocysteinase
MDYKIADLKLASEGRKKIAWAESRMPVLMALRKKYNKQKPFKGQRIAGCLHVTKETAVLIETLRASGAQVAWCGCNPLSTQDDVAAALVSNGISVFAWHGLSTEEYYWCIEQTLKLKPTLTLDDGGDLIFTVHSKHTELLPNLIGGTEETTTGIHRIRAMARQNALKYPILAVNDAETKWDFDNIYGTGQSSLDGILRATNILIAGKNFVVAGYGHCGKGVAQRARGLGANVIVTEVNPINALKAAHDGFRVMSMDDAASIGDIFITATGMKDVIVKRHMLKMKDGAILCNTGHYDCEVNLKHLRSISKHIRSIRHANEEYTLKDGRKIFLLAQGRLVNLASAEGHPSEVMDMSFANQFLGLLWLIEHRDDIENKVYDILPEQDQEVARLKLATMGITIDKLTRSQQRYLESWEEGT